MSEDQFNKDNIQQEKLTDASRADGGEDIKLDDARRIKVLSPGMLVLKRFLRNKLAITGLVILVAMFLFSFVGALFMPYSQAQVFKHDEEILKEYGSAMYNEDFRYIPIEGYDFPLSAQAQAVLAINKGGASFVAGGVTYGLEKLGEDFYGISGSVTIGTATMFAGKFAFTPKEGLPFEFDQAMLADCEAAVKSGQSGFVSGDTDFLLIRTGKTYDVAVLDIVAVASKQVYDAYNKEDNAFVGSFAFRHASEMAMIEGSRAFEADGKRFEIEIDDDGNTIVYLVSKGTKSAFAAISDILVSPISNDVFIPVDLKNAIREAVVDRVSKFQYVDSTGAEIAYQVDRVNRTYFVKTKTLSRLISTYERPSLNHLLGTDKNGMDVLTRLMYGGRISLMVGFVVILIETFIGVVMGGVSGYFGGWVDTFIMRFVDLFNSIPFYPTVMIIGAAMDKMEIEPTRRIFLLMAVLGILGWTGIARVVRGQILSLREQDFMVAAEATGIRITRRIFRHLIPNVMPLLIVQATMGLGGIIISEATLSFLGLGVKYPLASWGSIINAANDVFVLTNYWFIWFPAGLLIVLTVLGFNFVGDGLRDAFDPKMKR